MIEAHNVINLEGNSLEEAIRDDFGFEINNLNETLIDTRNSYKINIDYKFFFINKSVPNRIIQVKKELYLTYRGLLRVLFVSRSGKVDYFIKWATEKLFTIQMGTKINKEKLVIIFFCFKCFFNV